MGRKNRRSRRQRNRITAEIERLRVPCGCPECDGKRWPSHYVGSDSRHRAWAMSYECYIELTEPDPKYDRPVNGFAKRISPRMYDSVPLVDAMGQGMTVMRHGRMAQHVYVSGCAGCDTGMRPRGGSRFCLSCEDRIGRALQAEGWNQQQITAYFLTGEVRR